MRSTPSSTAVRTTVGLSTDIEFPVLTPAHRKRTLDTQYEVLAAYAREKGIGPQVDGRITRHKAPE